MKKYLKIFFLLAIIILIFFLLANKNFLKNILIHNLTLEFPKDEGAHEKTSSEWWYFKANLIDSQNPENIFGLTLLQFKGGNGTVFLVDVKNNKKYTQYTNEIFKYDSSKLGIVGEKSHWTENEQFNYEINYETDGIKTYLKLISEKNPVIISENPRNFSGIYYSQTQIDVSGKVIIEGQEYNVAGTGWIDHQFFLKDAPPILVNMSSSFVSGWKWWAVQLNNNTQIMISDIYFEKYGISKDVSSVRIFSKDSSATNFKKLFENEYELKTINYWKDEKSGKEYPTSWILKIPKENTFLEIKSMVNDQVFEGSSVYEGICNVSGTYRGEKVTGWSQFENVIKSKPGNI